MGESTTGTGRMILRHQCAKVCEVLDGEYTLPNHKEVDKDGKEHWGYSKDKSVVYGDTDSTYFVTHCTDNQQMITVADHVGKLVNDSFKSFMQDMFLCNPGYDDIISAEREIVSDRGIFVDKKRYILHIIDNEGTPCDKLKVMGLDTKRTTLPKPVSKQLNQFVERLLKGEKWNDIAQAVVDYKTQLNTTNDILSIGLPKGVKKVEYYTQEYIRDPQNTRLPGHVAASIFYNKCLDAANDKQSLRITSDMKIKVFYLKQKIDGFKSIALPVDIEQVPQWFYKFDIDRNAQIKRLVDNPLDNIIRAIGEKTPTKQSILENDLLSF